MITKKRLFWALAKIIELIPGRDGKIRTVRLKTQHGKMLRPIQRIYPLEIRSNEKIFKGVWRNQFPLYLKLCHPMRSLALGVMVWANIGDHRGVPNALQQQDNARPHAAHRVLPFLFIQGIRILPWSAFFPDVTH
ncbi:uncharacterized protein TNCV_2976941 [Trichonephila clavipes]|nr:uncharacterized protein TNCV_2976941 [Trichonephila clavipes]